MFRDEIEIEVSAGKIDGVTLYIGAREYIDLTRTFLKLDQPAAISAR